MSEPGLHGRVVGSGLGAVAVRCRCCRRSRIRGVSWVMTRRKSRSGAGPASDIGDEFTSGLYPSLHALVAWGLAVTFQSLRMFSVSCHLSKSEPGAYFLSLQVVQEKRMRLLFFCAAVEDNSGPDPAPVPACPVFSGITAGSSISSFCLCCSCSNLLIRGEC